VQIEVGHRRPAIAERPLAGQPADQRHALAHRAAPPVAGSRSNITGAARANDAQAPAGSPRPTNGEHRLGSSRCHIAARSERTPRSLAAHHRAAGRERQQGRGEAVDLRDPLRPAVLRTGFDVDLQRRARAHHGGGVSRVAGRREVRGHCRVAVTRMDADRAAYRIGARREQPQPGIGQRGRVGRRRLRRGQRSPPPRPLAGGSRAPAGPRAPW
jgi:hypothetical protein